MARPQLNLFEATPQQLPLTGDCSTLPEEEVLRRYFEMKMKYGKDKIVFYCWQRRIIVSGDDCRTVVSVCHLRQAPGSKFVVFDGLYCLAYWRKLNKAGHLVAVIVPEGEVVNFSLPG